MRTRTPILIYLTPQEQRQAEQEARARQDAAERRGFIPWGRGTYKNHLYGRAAEIGVSRYLGCVLDCDWSWEADRARGCDILGPDGEKYHVRSSRKGDRFIWRDGKDSRDGKWIFVDTSMYPLLRLTGWLSGYAAHLNAMGGYIEGNWLRQLPDKPPLMVF